MRRGTDDNFFKTKMKKIGGELGEKGGGGFSDGCEGKSSAIKLADVVFVVCVFACCNVWLWT